MISLRDIASNAEKLLDRDVLRDVFRRANIVPMTGTWMGQWMSSVMVPKEERPVSGCLLSAFLVYEYEPMREYAEALRAGNDVEPVNEEWITDLLVNEYGMARAQVHGLIAGWDGNWSPSRPYIPENGATSTGDEAMFHRYGQIGSELRELVDDVRAELLEIEGFGLCPIEYAEFVEEAESTADVEERELVLA